MRQVSKTNCVTIRGHHYTCRVPNFEGYLEWLAKDW